MRSEYTVLPFYYSSREKNERWWLFTLTAKARQAGAPVYGHLST
jgi:hypothetical protein